MIVALIIMSLATLRTVLYEKKARMLRQGRLRRRSLVATTSDFNLGKNDQSNLIYYYKLNLC